jgi:lysosomal alpha-mannosidase
LDTVTDALTADPTKRFIWVEIAYLQLWWDTHATNDRKQRFYNLLKNKQIEFANGGWVMNDEAIPTYTSVINQQTLGHQFIMVRRS